jgi:glutamine amidotransferase-like uncharacterized protein
VELVGPDFDPAALHAADVWVQPGGDAIELAKAISTRLKDELRRFVNAGGGYLGFCAGMFFADTWVDDNDTVPGLGLLPGTTRDYKTPEKATVLPVNWLGKIRYVFFEEGGYLELRPDAQAEVLARFSNGQVAAAVTRFGKGRVVVSGPHPEAPESWLHEHGLVDPDGPDFDLANNMFLRALPPRAREQVRARQAARRMRNASRLDNSVI